MKRRELIKVGLATLSTCLLAGCAKDKSQDEDETNEIVPKQTGTYEFSAALPFKYNLIDEIYEMNQKYKKSKVVTLYNNTPLPSTKNYNGWIMVLRGDNESIKGHKDFLKFASYAKNKGFEICYLMNSPKPFSKEDFDTFKKDFYYLLDSLYDNGITHIKIGNTQVATLINDYKHKFELSASTALEYHNTSQYVNLVKNYPNINLFNIAIDENYNFPFLRNLKKIFPDKKIELMVNDFCMKGCPARISHISSEFCQFGCSRIRDKNFLSYIYKMPAIFPWDLEYYSAIGINHFKVVSREKSRADITSTRCLNNYLNCVENGIEGYDIGEFFVDMFNIKTRIQTELSLIKPYLHDIKYFTKYGDLCASRCNATCFRCDEKAKELEEVIRMIIA